MKEHVSQLGSFLAQICFDHGNDTLSANLLEFPSNHFVCFKCLESSCCFLAHPGSSLGRLKSSLGRAGDKLASLLAHVTRTKSQGCQFPCWNCSGPLSFGLVHWFCPSNTNLPLLHGCASGSNSSGWKRACLGLHMLKV